MLPFLLLCVSYAFAAQFVVGKNPKNLNVCNYTELGFHVILDPQYIMPSIGKVACHSLGFQYAIIPSSDWEAAASAINHCVLGSVGILSYDGYVGTSKCQYMQESGAFGIGLSDNECTLASKMPLLCREYDTSKASATVDPGNNETSAGINAAKVKTPNYKVIKKQGQECVLGTLHLISIESSLDDSQQQCTSRGYKLADLNQETLTRLYTLWTQCGPQEAVAWIGSLEGESRGLCRFVYSQAENVIWTMVSEGEHPCILGDAMVLCEELN